MFPSDQDEGGQDRQMSDDECATDDVVLGKYLIDLVNLNAGLCQTAMNGSGRKHEQDGRRVGSKLFREICVPPHQRRRDVSPPLTDWVKIASQNQNNQISEETDDRERRFRWESCSVRALVDEPVPNR